MPTVATATSALALPPTTENFDDVPAFLDRKLNGITPAPAIKAPVKIPYAGKEKPAETRELKAAAKALPDSATNPQVTPKALPAGGGSAAALRKKLKAATAPKVAKPAKLPKVAKPAKVASKEKASGTATKAAKTKLNSRTKLEAITALLLRKSGTTNAEILEVTRWPSVSVPQQAKAAGLKLRKEKVTGEPTRYFGSK